MRSDRIRARMKAEGKTIKDILRERNEAFYMYAGIMAHIKKNFGIEMVKILREEYEPRAKRLAKEHEGEMLAIKPH